jgi:hypothetical protein
MSSFLRARIPRAGGAESRPGPEEEDPAVALRGPTSGS